MTFKEHLAAAIVGSLIGAALVAAIMGAVVWVMR